MLFLFKFYVKLYLRIMVLIIPFCAFIFSRAQFEVLIPSSSNTLRFKLWQKYIGILEWPKAYAFRRKYQKGEGVNFDLLIV